MRPSASLPSISTFRTSMNGIDPDIVEVISFTAGCCVMMYLLNWLPL